MKTSWVLTDTERKLKFPDGRASRKSSGKRLLPSNVPDTKSLTADPDPDPLRENQELRIQSLNLDPSVN